MKNKKKMALGTALIAGCLIIGGTFAWFSTKDKVSNKFDMDAFDVAITEDFDQNPDVPLVPGATITKAVTVTNSGNMDVLVRVQLEEVLKLLARDTESGKDKLKITYTADKSPAEGQVPVIISDDMIQAYKDAGYKENAENVPVVQDVTVLQKITTADTNANTVYSYVAYVTDTKQVVKVTPQGPDKSKPTGFNVEYAYHTYKDNNKDGVTAIHGKEDTKLDTYYGNGTFHDAVVLNFAENVQTDGGTLLDTTKWYLGKDGYFYYTEKLAGNSISAPLLKSVSIAKEAGNLLQGAHYELNPMMEATQTDHEAVKGNWIDLNYTNNADTPVGAVNGNDTAGINQLIANILNKK